MKIYFIRHGATMGNLAKKYIGITDEELCPEGISELKNLMFPVPDLLICSPLKRCVQSAQILFPGQEVQICEDFRECDFGDFENHNYQELTGNPDYQYWIDSGGLSAFPGGECPEDFKKRTIKAFARLMTVIPEIRNMTLVVHGGTIMSILEHYAIPKKSYYDWQIPNAHGYVTEFDRIQQKIIVLEKI